MSTYFVQFIKYTYTDFDVLPKLLNF